MLISAARAGSQGVSVGEMSAPVAGGVFGPGVADALRTDGESALEHYLAVESPPDLILVGPRSVTVGCMLGAPDPDVIEGPPAAMGGSAQTRP